MHTTKKDTELRDYPKHTVLVQEDGTNISSGSCIKIRYLIAFLLFFAIGVSYSMRSNMSIAIVAMTDSNSGYQSFNWTSKTQNTILSSFFWGYAVNQIPSGLIAQAVGAKWILLGGIFVNSLVSMLTPAAASVGGWGAVCTIRVLQGLTQAVVFPSSYNLIAKWAPLTEKGRISVIVFTGTQVGTILGLPLSGFLANSLGWPSIFYVLGGFGIVWCIVWAYLGASQPSEHRFISVEEVKYIEASLGSQKEKIKFNTPWKDIMTSGPIWALFVAHTATSWGFWTLLTEMPLYMKHVFHFDIKANGLLTALPYTVMAILNFIFGYIADVTINKGYISILSSRRLFNSIGYFSPAICLAILGYIPADEPIWAVLLLVLSIGLNSGASLGFHVNYIDLTPNFSGTVFGVSNCLAAIVAFLAPLTVGQIVTDESDTSQWRIIFWIAAVYYAFGNIVFLIFSRAEVQPWNDPNYRNKNDQEEGENENEDDEEEDERKA